jgi:hypothetical protein
MDKAPAYNGEVIPTSTGPAGVCVRSASKALPRRSSSSKADFRFKHKLLSLDCTVIPQCFPVFDWAH